MEIQPPVSKSYVIEFNDDATWAYVDLTKITDTKVFFNSIINTIIVHFQNHPEKVLHGVTFTHSDQQTELYHALCRQMDLFDLSFSNIERTSSKFIFDDGWKDMIEKGLGIDFSEWEKCWSEYKGLLTYKTVTEPYIQLRYFGYQIAKFDPKKSPDLKNMVLVNNKNGIMDFDSQYKFVVGKRSLDGDKEKLEHFLESTLLQKIQENSLDINGVKIEKLFNSRLSFQFPTLRKTGTKSRTDNSPKYADIFAKSNNRPVIMELKVHKDTGNSRGEYVFNAFGQLLNYFVFLKDVFTDTNQLWDKHLSTVKDLDWNNPLLYVIVDDLGTDSRAGKFREYIDNIKKYFKTACLIRFVEVDSNYKQKLNFKHEI